MEHPHTNKILPKKERSLVLSLMNEISEHYWLPLRNYLNENKELVKTFPALLIDQEHIILYIGRTHLAIEYFGKEQTKQLPESKKITVTCCAKSPDFERLKTKK